MGLQQQALDALGKPGDVEIDQEPTGGLLKTKVGQELGQVNREELGDGFDLDNQSLFDDQVDDVAVADLRSLVAEYERDLLRYWIPRKASSRQRQA
ncbi:MAG TPA: hypothetical protein VHR43_01285 [Gemmatimonadales bacterium]|nr:hypothetical protein [Gemmatimonadales bacterium]